MQISHQQNILRWARSVLNLPKAFDKKLLVLPEQNTHLFAKYFIHWPNNAIKILIIKAHAALVYFYLQVSM